LVAFVRVSSDEEVYMSAVGLTPGLPARASFPSIERSDSLLWDTRARKREKPADAGPASATAGFPGPPRAGERLTESPRSLVIVGLQQMDSDGDAQRVHQWHGQRKTTRERASVRTVSSHQRLSEL